MKTIPNSAVTATSTIPSTSKELRVPYTVVGGKRVSKTLRTPYGFSILLLNRGGRFNRAVVFTELEKLGADEIISIEGPSVSYDVESLSRRFQSVRFLILHENTTRGEQVNIGIQEAHGKFVFVLWNDMRVTGSTISARFIEKLSEHEVLCTVPVLQNARAEVIPSIQAPAFYRKLLRIVPLQPVKDSMLSLFPADYCGIYHKKLFSLTGGYDYGLTNPFWQKMDFGFRSHMWGERIELCSSIRVSYEGDVPVEDTTPDESYKFFYLKNLSVRFNGDSGVLPAGRLLPYLFRSGSGPFQAVAEFREVRKWMRLNRFRFRQDAQSVTELWEVPEE
jgi:hypothetical protein